MNFLQLDARAFFLFGMRFFFGIWLLYAGFVKWFFIGPNAFVGFITADFDKTWSPHILNVALAWVIMIAEPTLALWVLSGKKPRGAWGCMSLLMFMLMLGQSLLMKPQVTDNWHYVILTLVCAALSGPCTKNCEK